MKSTLLTKKHSAFTLIELLVVIAIIAILAAILMPVLESAQARGYQASCMSNLHEQGLAFTIYTSDSNGKYPDLRSPPFAPPANPPDAYGVWPWDISTNFTTIMISDGCSRNVFYDPAYAAFNSDLTWDFNPNFRILDYVYLLPGSGQNMDGPNNGGTYPEQPYWRTNSLMIPGQQTPATTELVVDVVIYDSATKNYANIAVGGLVGTLVQRTSHLTGSLPSGGNELYEDGHVQWIPWSHMYNGRTGLPLRYFGPAPPIFIY